MMSYIYKTLLPLIFLGLLPVQAYALFPEEIESQREHYSKARTALKQKDYYTYKKSLRELGDYPLKPLLEFEYLKNRVNVTPTVTLHEYINTYNYMPQSDFLRERWLKYLVGRGDWDTFIKEYKDSNDRSLKCHKLNYLLRTSADQLSLMKEVEKLWLTSRRLPSACNPVFKRWQKAGHMDKAIVWARIKLAMERRRVSLARSIARRYLEQIDNIWFRRWESVHHNPKRELRRISYRVETPVARQIVKHGIVRMAYRDPEAAMEMWEKMKIKFAFFGEDESYILRRVGVLAARHHSRSAFEWLARVSAADNDKTLRMWRLRAALREGEWSTARYFLASLSEAEQNSDRWRYWRARILEHTDEKEDAMAMYRALSRERGYYGFLAADRIGAEYSMRHRSVQVNDKEKSAMLLRAGMVVAQELYITGEMTPARRQWNWMAKRMNKNELKIAAVIAGKWGWHDRAIYTVNRAKHMDDLDLRFPVLYRDMVETNAERTGIDTSWIYGVMRQESAFVQDARSPVGALGLMQLMPRTGRQVGRKLKMRIRSKSSILKVENNLLLGASYLKTVLDTNKGNQMLATASYNAGPHRVRRWLPEESNLAGDIWVETIPFDETRNYVKNVLGFTAIYDHRLGGEPRRLTARMGQAKPYTSR
ncbi:MAG: transglycosylase SLT domain-containing protein [Proteobacteria bacterium]|nr:transglycosylase SLT domain-containing protein [Pseudomonadota bacterium]